MTVDEPGPRPVGVLLPRSLPAAQVVPYARRAEDLGFAELWVVEDCGFRGGTTQAGVVLASTSTIRVGVGILPAAARNAAFTAMEVATLAELFPGRIDVGIGHGMPAWMRQVGTPVVGSVGLLEEHLRAVRAAVHGQAVQLEGDHVRLEGFRLETPPARPPRVLAGVRGPRSLAASGRSADGTVLAEPVTPEYLRRCLAGIGAPGPHRVVTYDVACVDDDPAVARAAVRPALAVVGEPDWAPHVDPLPFAGELRSLRAGCVDGAELARRMPDAWVDRLALVGTPATVRAQVAARHDAGATVVVMTPVGDDPLVSLTSLASAL